MNARQQLEEYRKRQEARFRQQEYKEEDDDLELPPPQNAYSVSEEEEQHRIEQRDLELARELEQQLNFRHSPSFVEEMEQNNPDYRLDDIGDEGHPAPIPQNIDRAPQSNLNFNANRNTYVKQDPPKWLMHPITLQKDNTIKVYDFTNGSLNNELRKTTDSSINYEYEDIEDPLLTNHDPADLEDKIAKKQKKYLKRFYKEEDLRVEEAKRSGSIIEERKQSVESDDSNGIGINEPLLQNNPAPVINNNVNNAQPRMILPGIYRQPNGTYRLC